MAHSGTFAAGRSIFMKRLLVLAAVFALSVLAADVTGTWKATAEGPNGTMERTFVLKAEGDKLTGEATKDCLARTKDPAPALAAQWRTPRFRTDPTACG